MSKSTYLIILLLSFLLGIVGFNFSNIDIFVLGLMGLGLIIFSLFFPKLKFLVLIIFVGLSLAFLRLEFINNEIADNKINFYNNQEVTIIAQVSKEVDRKIDKQKIILQTKKIFMQNSWLEVKGKILLTTSLYPEYFYGDVIKIISQLKTPESFLYKNEYGQEIEFQYDNYLKRYGIFSLVYYPKEIEVIKTNQGNFLLTKLLNLKKELIKKVNLLLPEPQASFLGGLLWGAKSSIDPELLELFNKTGTTHIVALSGFNITIIGVLLFLLAPWLFIKRQAAYWLVITIIILFVLFTGGQASVVRAAIMGILALTAYYLGRPKGIFILLILAAAVMIAINPLVLFYDVGFQLSFLATIGLIYLAPKLEIYFLWLTKRFAVRESVVATLSAIIITLPLIAYQFKRVSLIAPLTNVLILPAIPAVMAVGFLAIIISLVNFRAGQIFTILTWLLLSYVIFVVQITAQIPSTLLLVDINLSSVGVLYFLLFLFIIYLYRFELKRFKILNLKHKTNAKQ